ALRAPRINSFGFLCVFCLCVLCASVVRFPLPGPWSRVDGVGRPGRAAAQQQVLLAGDHGEQADQGEEQRRLGRLGNRAGAAGGLACLSVSHCGPRFLATKPRTLLTLMAKAMPWAPSRRAMLMPISWPWALSSGPPELPGLMLASVWIRPPSTSPVGMVISR